MPGTIRGKQEPPSAPKDAISTPPAAGKVDPKNKLSSAGKGGDSAKSSTDKSTDASKSSTDKTSKSTDAKSSTDKSTDASKSSTDKTSKSIDASKSSTDKTSKSNDASKSAGTSTPTSSARQRARDRRRGRIEASPEPDSNSPDAGAASGRIRNLAGFWSTPKDEVQVVRKKRLEVADRTEKADSETDSSDSDSDFDGLKRAQEAQPSSEKLIEIEKGRAKSIANMWQNRKDEYVKAKKTPFKLDIKTEEPTVFENEPVILEGVVRSDDLTLREEIVVNRPGRIKNLAVNFATISQSKPDSSDDEDGPTEKRSSVTTKKKTTEEVIEHGKIRNVRERWKKRQQKSTAGASDSDSEGDESSATEDTPQRSSRTSDQIIEQAKMRNLRERWRQRQDGSDEKDEATQARRSGPVRLHSLVTAAEYGVFENEPIVRDDVVRADDEQPDIISGERTQKLRRMWTMMDKEVMKDKEPAEQVVKTTKKKVEKREPEPEVLKPQASKLQKGVAGRLRSEAKDESPKRKDDGNPGKGQRSTARELESGKELPKDQQQHQQPDGKGKLQKAFTVTSAGESKPSAPKSPSLMRYSSRKKVI